MSQSIVWLTQESGSVIENLLKAFLCDEISSQQLYDHAQIKTAVCGEGVFFSCGRDVHAEIWWRDTEGSSAEHRCTPDNSIHDRTAGR